MKNTDYLRSIPFREKFVDMFDISRLEDDGVASIVRLPFSIRVLLENLLRKLDGRVVREEDLLSVARWAKRYDRPVEIPFHPARVLMQDFTGVPAVVDLAAMRDAVEKQGGDPRRINPLTPTDLVIDHSVQMDASGTGDSIIRNVKLEYERNGERYALLKWAQRSFDNFRVAPPNSGICHQINLEYLARVVMIEEKDGRRTAFPDTLVGTDSHTTMINGLGVAGWGVGGIEAEAVMLGEPYHMSIPEVIGVRMTGSLGEGVTATDLVLTLTEMLRGHRVVEKFVEFFGPGARGLTIPDRATVANMAPEYGATMGFFPVDEKTVDYLVQTGRRDQARFVEQYTRTNLLFSTGKTDPEYTTVLSLDLGTVEACVAGPARPQDRIPLSDICRRAIPSSPCATARKPSFPLMMNGRPVIIGDGSVVIAAITSCTNTSNPQVLIGTGLLARNAVERGLRVPAHVKTSFAPGSRVVADYLGASGLMPGLQALGFHIAGFGCATCIGNSGPLHPEIESCIARHDLTVAAVLSGNRNFEARIHQRIRANFLMSPMLVVAFALAGRIDFDPTVEPLAMDPNGEPVFLRDIWPSSREIDTFVAASVKTEAYETRYSRLFEGDAFWKGLPDMKRLTFQWDPASTYIKHPPYFDDFTLRPPPMEDIRNARCLLVLGDSVTTDHISPAGAIPSDYPAGQYLIGEGVNEKDFNSYGARRGNHEVMLRGTFGNIRIKNRLAGNREGSRTVVFPDQKEMYVYDAAMKYGAEGVPLVVLGGLEYGTGSSRDWAAKGTRLLGVKAVLAQSFERIHRANLVGMGVLPLVFREGESREFLGLDGSETFTIKGVADIRPRKALQVIADHSSGKRTVFEVIARLDTEVDVEYYRHGGILPYVLRRMMAETEMS